MREPLSFHRVMRGTGAGPTLVWLHGFMGSERDFRTLTLDHMEMFTHLFLDLPGHGRTPLPIETGEAGYLQVIDSLATELRDRAKSPRILIGYSQGGRLALSLACAYPRLLDGLVLISTSPGLDDEGERKKRSRADALLAKRLRTEDRAEFLDKWYSQSLFATLKQNALVLQQLLVSRETFDMQAAADSLEITGTSAMPSCWNQLDRLDIPTLYIAGEQDRNYVKIGKQMKKKCPDMSLEIVKDSSHALHLEKPLVFMERIEAFLDEHFKESTDEAV